MFDKAKVKVSQGIGEIDMKYNLSQKKKLSIKIHQRSDNKS